MEIKAFKMDGLGNDFVIIDRRKNPVSISKEKIIELGKRDNIGFDQMIFIDENDIMQDVEYYTREALRYRDHSQLGRG